MRPRSHLLAGLAGGAIASALAHDGAEFAVDSGLTQEMEQLLHDFAPVINLSSLEEYFPSSVEYMLPHYEMLNVDGRAEDYYPAPPLNASSLTHLPYFGRGSYLSVREEHNPQPFLEHLESWYLHGPDWPGRSESSSSGGSTGGPRKEIDVPVYAFHVDKGDGIVDLFYWTFYPFNLGKQIGPLGILGNHVGDWEHLRIRTVNGSGFSADYIVHQESLALGQGTTRWVDVPKVNGRPIAYSAAGSHGLWATPGSHVFANALNIFKLIDETDDKGMIWDTRRSLVPIQWWEDPSRRTRKRIHSDESGLGWLNYAGRWGNKGERDCAWKRLELPCQLDDGPGGPNRDFRSPPGCIIAPLYPRTIGYSTFTFKIDSSAAAFANDHKLFQISVELLCSGDKELKDKQSVKEAAQAAFLAGDRADAYSTRGFADFKGLHDLSYTITTSGCGRIRSSVQAYRISLCPDAGKCATTSYRRRICTYTEGARGYTKGRNVRLVDADPWRWSY